MVFFNKGQNTAGGAAAFIAIIAGALLLYILLVPPEVREQLLDDDYKRPIDNGDDPGNDIDINQTLLSEAPGRITHLMKDEFDHHLSSFNLYSTRDSKSRTIGQGIYVRRGVFEEKNDKVEFDMPHKELVDNIYLDFNLNQNRENKGSLRIWLNGRKIFDSEVGRSLTSPISISDDIIEEENVMEFEVSGVGWKFWTINEYEVNDLEIFYTEIDKSRQRSEQTFMVSETEKHNLDFARIEFNADCNPRTAGVLEVRLNRQNLYSSVPDCGHMNRFDVPSEAVNEGQNRLEFEAREGDFLITNAKVRTHMEEMTFPVYYFQAPEDIFTAEGNLKSNLDVYINFDFLDDGTQKSARVFINGQQFYMDTRDKEYERRINGYIEEGNNAIKIEPDRRVLDIIRFTVKVK